jgi:hypothetical protein
MRRLLLGTLLPLIGLVCFSRSSAHTIILYLADVASESSNADLHTSLSALHHVFLEKNPQYQVVVTYDYADRRFLTPALRATLTQRLNDGPTDRTPPISIRFVPIRDFRRVPWPFSMYTDVYTQTNPYYARLGYRHMCRFWSHRVFRQPFMRNVTRYLRLDTDNFLVHMPVDPFAILDAEPHLVYLASVMYKEDARQVDGLWETVLRFAVEEDLHPWGLAPLAQQRVDTAALRALSVRDAAEVLYRHGYNLDYFYNNWEVSRVDVWRSPLYRRFARHIDAAGGIIVRRWGDAPIRTLALFLLRDALTVDTNGTDAQLPPFRQYRGLRVFHKALHDTMGGSEAPV